MTSNVVLVRHAQVAACYKGICYGRSDVPLGPEGLEQSDRIADILSCLPIRYLVTSPAARAQALAQRIAERTGLGMTVEPALLERDFGAWEMRSWDAIYQEVGDALSGLIHEPESYRPPAGETTLELRDRVMAWYDRRPRLGLGVVVAHGGPIAAIRGTLAGKSPIDWVSLIPQPGTWVRLTGGIGELAHASEGSRIE
jgi:broad specificity phosphatase PhoE